MPDFEQLYNPEPQEIKPLLPEPELTPIDQSFRDYNPEAYIPQNGSAFAEQQFGDFERKFSKPSVNQMLEPVPYDPEESRRDRYVNSDYFSELGFNPFEDNEELYGQRQTVGNKLKNAFKGMGVLAYQQFKEQLGSWGDTVGALGSGSIKSAFQETEMEELYRQQQQFFNDYAIFETEAQRDSIFNINTVANILQQSGYAVGAIAEIAAEELALTALTAASFGAGASIQAARTAKLASVLKKTAELNKSLNNTNNLRKVFGKVAQVLPLTNTAEFLAGVRTINRIENIASGGNTTVAAAKTAAKGFGAFYRDVRELNAAVAEAKAEAAGTYGNLISELTRDFRERNGRDPDQFELEDIRNTAIEASHVNGGVNTLAILMTNKIAFGNALRGFKPLRYLVDEDVARGVVMLSDKQALKTGTKLVEASSNKWLAFRQKMLSSPLKYTAANLSEGAQESIQSISGDAVEAYYQAKYNGEAKDWTDTVKQAAANQFSVEGAKTFLSGFVTGSILATGGKLISKGNQGIQFFSDRTGYNERVSKERAARKQMVDSYNAVWNNPLGTPASVDQMQLQSNFANLLKQAAATGDKKFFNDIKDDAAREFILTGIKSGSLDTLTSRMKDYLQELSPEEFTKAFGVEYTEKLHRDMVQAAEQFQNRAEVIRDIYDKLNTTYSNPFNPSAHKSGTPEYFKALMGNLAYRNAIDQMVFMKDSYQRALARQTEILAGISDQEGMANVGFNTVYTLGSPEELSREIKLLSEEIKGQMDPRIKSQKEQRRELLRKYKDVLDGYMKQHQSLLKNLKGADQEKAIQDLDQVTRDQIKPLVGDVLNQKLKEDNQPSILPDVVEGTLDRFMDYYKLHTEAGQILDHVNLVADPLNFNAFLNRHVDVLEKLSKEEQTPETEGPRRTVTVKVTDKDGKEHEIELREGDTYITESDPAKRLTPKGRVVQTWDQDIIEIVSLEDDSVTFELNNSGEAVSMTLEEFAQSVGRIWNLASMTPEQRIYFKNRNKVFDLNVRKSDGQPHDITGKHIDNNYSGSGIYVKARLALKKEGEDYRLKVIYTNPATKEPMEIDYNRTYLEKYHGAKWDLSIAPEVQEALAKKNAAYLQSQMNMLSRMIEEQESALNDLEQRSVKNEEDFILIELELEDMKAAMDKAVKELEANPWSRRGRKPNRVKLVETLQEKILSLETKLENLKKERQDLAQLKDTAVKFREVFYQALDELERDGNSFRSDAVARVERQIEESRSQMITKKFNPEQLDTLISDTEADLKILDERISFIQHVINTARKLLEALKVFDDLSHVLDTAQDRKNLIAAVRQLEEQQTSSGQWAFPESVRKAIFRGDLKAVGEILSDIIKNSSRDMTETMAKRDELAAKLHRLETTQGQLEGISRLQERVDFLKTLQEGVSSFQERQRQAALLAQNQTGIDAAAGQQELLSEDVDPDITKPTFSQEKKPKFASTGFFKTFGRQYLDDKDTEPNRENGTDRFFEFTGRQSVKGEGYFLEVVTPHNDKFGIRQPEYPNELKVIVVKKDKDGNYQYVDVEGNVLEAPTKDNIVYRSLANIESWTPARVREQYSDTDHLSDAQIQQFIDEHKAHQQSMIDRSKEGPVYLEVTSASPGVQRVERLATVDENGKHPVAEAEVEGRVIVDDPDWRDLRSANNPDKSIALRVSTGSQAIGQGILPGRIVMQEYTHQGVDKNWSDKVVRVFNRQLNQQEKDTIVEVLVRLSKLFGRSRSTDPVLKLSDEEQKEFNLILNYLKNTLAWGQPGKSHRFFWIDKGLHRGDLKIEFTEEAIRASAAQLMDGVYHHVNNRTLLKDGSFVTVKIKDGKVVADKVYESYTQYLLEKREDGVPPVYTSLPRVDSGTPQRTNVYLNWNDPAVETTPIPVAPVKEIKKPEAEGDGKVIWAPGQAAPKPADPIKSEPTEGKLLWAPGGAKPETEKPAQVTTEGKLLWAPSNVSQNQQPVPAADAAAVQRLEGPFFDIAEAVTHAVQEGNTLKATVHARNVHTGETRVALEATVPIVNGNIPDAKNRLRTALLKQVEPDEDHGPEYRLSLDEFMETEDFKAVAEFFKKNLPQIPVRVAAQLIHGKAWGAFMNGAVYLYEKAEIGTAYHEAFETVWGLYLTDKEKVQLGKEFRSREGSFTNPFTKETKSYSQASDYDVKEMLSEEFRRYVLDGKLPRQSAIAAFFRKIWEVIQKLLGMTPAKKRELDATIHKVFNKLGTGGYKNARPLRERNLLEPAYRKVGGLTQSETTEVIEGLTYEFFLELFKNGYTIDTLIAGLNVKMSNRLLNNLYDKALGRVMDTLSVDQVVAEVAAHSTQDLYREFRKGLKKYGIRFDEEVLTKEEDAGTVNALGIRDTISVDPRKMTETNVRMLVSTLPDSVYNQKGFLVARKNRLGLSKQVDGDRIHVILLNELSNIVSYVDKDGNKIGVLEQMFQRLDSKYITEDGRYRDGYGWIWNLKKRLKMDKPAASLTYEEMALRIAFTKSFTNVNNVPEKTIIEEGGSLYNFNPVSGVNTARVRETWANNLKERLRPGSNNLLKIETDGSITINRNTEAYNTLIGHLSRPGEITLEKSLSILSHLGIEFSGNMEPYAALVRENTIQILEQIRNENITTVSDLYDNQVVGARMNRFLELEASFSSDENILSYSNAEGKPQYSVGIPSLLSNTINILNTVGSLKELVQTAPWLGTVVNGEPVLYGYNAGSQLLKPGGILFDKNGNRRRSAPLTCHVVSGMGVSDFEGINTSDLQFPERVANKIHFLLKNIVFSNINSDKSTEFGIGLPGKHLVDINTVNHNGRKMTEIYLDHLRDELYSAQLESRNPSHIQYYSQQVLSLGHFRDVLGSKLVEKFKKEVLGDKARYKGELAYNNWLQDNLPTVQAAINNHIQARTQETVQFLKDLDIFEFVNGVWITNAIDNEALKELLNISDSQKVTYTMEGESLQRTSFTESDLSTLAGFLAVNEEILLTEQHKLIYGHPALYKDLPKRANGATSTKEPIVDDPEVIGWADLNMERHDGKSRSGEQHQTMSVISFKDQNVVSLFHKDVAEGMYEELLANGMNKTTAEKVVGAKFNESGELTGFILNEKGEHTGQIKAYTGLNEADAMGWILPDMLRDLLFFSGKLTSKQLKQWEYEIAYEKVVRSNKPKSHPAYKRYSTEELRIAQEIVDQGDPGYIFQVLKPQYFGYAENGNMTHTVFLKHAVQPKFYRHVEGSQYEALYIASQNKQIDIIGFESGEKVGNRTDTHGQFTDLYNANGEINLVNGQLPSELPVQKLYTRFYGIQVETPNFTKNSVVRGTQVTKLVMVNFYENGQPVTEKAGELISEMNSTLERMMQLGKDKLLKELGLEKTNEGYVTKDIRKLVSTLRAEAENRDLPDNMIDALNAIALPDGGYELEYKFDTLINREKIDAILNSIVDSRVISEKFHGKASVQVAPTGYESNPRGYVYLKDGVYIPVAGELTEEERKTVRLASSDLKFYHREDGGISGMECYIAWPFEGVTPEELGLKLENGVYLPGNMDPRLLRAIGFRIPTQGMNSIENIVIKGFTPAGNGDMIVVPSEIVGKAGSDFDIDKLNIYLPNFVVETPSRSFESEEFLEFMKEDLVFRGLAPADADAILSAYTVKDFQNINQATYTDKGKEEKGAPFSLSDLVEEDVYDQVAFIKKSITNFNRQFKGKKELVYTETGKDTTASLQNYYINLMSELISLPENFRQLVTPNGAETLKELATDITQMKVKAGTKKVVDEKSFSYLRSFIGSTTVRERYLTAKRMVGIAALHNTFHAMAQVSGLKLSGKYEPVYFLPGDDSLQMKLTHHGPDEQGHYPVGFRTDVSKQWISDLLSEALTGFVDGAKDPFVFDLNFSMNTASVWFYLQHMGVPADEVAYFMNQPILDEYFKKEAVNTSNFKSVNGEKLGPEWLFYTVAEPFFKKATGSDNMRILLGMKDAKSRSEKQVRKMYKETVQKQLEEIDSKYERFSTKDLIAAIKKGSQASPQMQVAVLMSYLKYKSQAFQLSGFIQAIGYDNKKTRSIQENMYQTGRWGKSVNQGFIQNPESVLENTFLGEMKKQKEDIPNMFQNFFITLDPRMQHLFRKLEDKLSDPDLIMKKEAALNMINRYQNFLVAYLLHTTEIPELKFSLNALYQDMLFGERSMARRLMEFKKDGVISEHKIIKELLPIISSDTQRPDSIRLFRSRMDTMTINNVIESLNELRGYGVQTANQELVQFTTDLAVFSILQSGVQASTLDFRKVLPREIYSELVKTILDRFNPDVKLDEDHIWKSFHQNNWHVRSVVPKAPGWCYIKDGAITIPEGFAAASHDYLLKYVRKTGLSHKQAREQGPSAYHPVLFEKQYEGDKGWVYTPIPRLGDGPRMIEVYTDDRGSVLTKNSVEQYGTSTGPRSGPATLFDLAEFSAADRAKIMDSYASKHGITLQEALSQINEALAVSPKEAIEKIKECYLTVTS